LKTTAAYQATTFKDDWT